MSNFYTRMKAYREKLNLSQKKLAEKVNVSRETILRLEKGKYNPSLKLAVDIADELHAEIKDICVFAESEEEDARIFQRRDEYMLEAGYIDPFEQKFQEGFEIGISSVPLDMLTIMAKRALIYMSEEKWKRYKKSKEKKYRKYREEHPDCQEDSDKYYDHQGELIEEKWVESQKDVMDFMEFPENGWDDLCFFAKKYSELTPGALARRVLRESEYKYI